MKRFLLATTLAATVAMSPVQAADFAILVYETPADFALRTEPSPQGQAYWAAWAAYAETLQKAGAIRDGAPFQLPPATGIGRSGSTGNDRGKVHLGGYFRIEAASFADAAALAAQAPSVDRGGGAEVLAVQPTPGMSR